jgi:cytochrome c
MSGDVGCTLVRIAKRGKTHLNVSWSQNPVSRHRQSITISILIFINSPWWRIDINSRSLRGSVKTTREPFRRPGHMSARFTLRGLGLGAGLILCLPTALEAADSGQLAAARGKAILQDKCGRCHAIEAVGESPLKTAPPMRDIYGRFNPRELQAELSEGKVSKHREMPQIDFSDEDVHAILTYLYALAVRK